MHFCFQSRFSGFALISFEFGSKRVAVKVEKDKINVRVGGGYLSIDEFLDQYTPAELERLERRDPLKRFSEKVAV